MCNDHVKQSPKMCAKRSNCDKKIEKAKFYGSLKTNDVLVLFVCCCFPTFVWQNESNCYNFFNNNFIRTNISKLFCSNLPKWILNIKTFNSISFIFLPYSRMCNFIVPLIYRVWSYFLLIFRWFYIFIKIGLKEILHQNLHILNWLKIY